MARLRASDGAIPALRRKWFLYRPEAENIGPGKMLICSLRAARHNFMASIFGGSSIHKHVTAGWTADARSFRKALEGCLPDGHPPARQGSRASASGVCRSLRMTETPPRPTEAATAPPWR